MVSAYLKASYASVLLPALGAAVLLALAALSLWRGGRRKTNLLFAAICFMGGLINADVSLVNLIPDKATAVVFDRFVYLFFVFSLPVYIAFVHALLGIDGRKRLEWGAFAVSVCFLAVVPTDLFIRGVRALSFGFIAEAGEAFHLFSLFATVSVGYCLVTLYQALRTTADNHQRNRVRYVLVGMGLTSLLLGLNILPVSGIDVYPPGNFSFIPASVLAIGVLKYDLLDMGAVFRRSLFYFFLTLLLTLLYWAVMAALNLILAESNLQQTLLMPLLLALFMVALFNPVRFRLQRVVNRIFVRGKYSYRHVLRETSERLNGQLQVAQIREILLGTLKQDLQLASASLILREGDDYVRIGAGETASSPPLTAACASVVPLFCRLRRPLGITALDDIKSVSVPEKQALEDLFRNVQATLLVPMIFHDSLVGVLALGQKLSGELFFQEDLELLQTVANQAATALVNARTYGQLEALNRDLEAKVEERTKALREALAEKERTQQQLIRSESLAAIGQLVAGAAHELNNPLAGASSLIQTGIETIEEGMPEEASRIELLDDLRFSLKELKRAEAIVKSLLGLSRQSRSVAEEVDLAAVLEDSLRVLHNLIKKGRVTIEKDYDPACPPVTGHFAELGQVFLNLIKNAVQAIPDGQGAIRLVTRYDALRRRVAVECRDNGVGIPEAELRDIFKPFFTTKPVGQGTGLGLYISHEIVRRYGGNIAVSSRHGEGTVFTVEFPQGRERS